VFLATKLGRCIRFQITDDNVRVFSGRDSSGVRGIKLSNGDEVISLTVLRHVEATPDERAAYLKHAASLRRNGEDEAVEPTDGQEPVAELALSEARITELAQLEEILLTVTDAGFGKRSSAYEYRVTGRGGQGIANITLSAKRNGKAVAASFQVRPGDDVMLVTDSGRLIRVPVDQVRITGRSVMGVTLVRVDVDEHVTSVFPVVEQDQDQENDDA
jgi:DNA gyrase subunit A